jgi:3-deoxy-D-manno-octulosonic-acid transferase
VRKNYQGADHVSYLPFDTPRNASRFVKIVNPALAIFVKYEFWYHYSRQLKKQNIPTISISSIFRPSQMFFSSLGSFYSRILQNFSHFFVQNSESVKLLNEIGINQVTIAGDTRFDRVYQIVSKAEEIPIAKKFKAEQKVVVVGSCWAEDLEVLLPFINENRVKFIIAPHEVSEQNVVNIEKALQVKSVRYSRASEEDLDEYSVLIIDNIGLLARLYRYGEFAYIGGAFGKGLHNILEAACYGVPIFFGNKNYDKFQEAVDLINRGGAFEIRDYPDLKAKYEMLNIPTSFLLACEVTRQYVEENLGATSKIMDYCRPLLKHKTE